MLGWLWCGTNLRIPSLGRVSRAALADGDEGSKGQTPDKDEDIHQGRREVLIPGMGVVLRK